MAEVTASIDVPVAQSDTWAAVTDWARQSDWIPATQARATDQDGRGVGGRLEARTGIGPVGFVDSMEITGWEEPHRCVVRHTGRVVRGAGAFEVEPLADGGSRVPWTEWVQPPLGRLGYVAWFAVRPAVEASLRLALRRFAA